MVATDRYPHDETLSKRAVEILALLAEGLSDREIAERLVMTINTIKWYNRQIYSILGVGSRTQAIARARDLRLLEPDNRPDSSLRPAPILSDSLKHYLPAEITRFIGRNRETETLKRMLRTVRLLTLTGSPGTGKTRLALHVASEVLHEFADGVYFVSLAPLSSAAQVPGAVAATLGVTESVNQPLVEGLKRRLRNQKLLLILDNFEHVLAGASLVSELLTATTEVRFLITSREVLHLYGEQEYPVPSLTLPEPTPDGSLSELAQCESVALFVQQARALKPDFALNEENALDIAKICVRLDGLPLAIELAAARIKLLNPRLLLSRLTNRLNTLTGGANDLPTRQRTLRNTIEWSYNLLDKGEKTLFARLAVFQGGRSLEGIEAICGADLAIDVFAGLESLVHKNLIQQTELVGTEPRFVMLETLHEYASERLEASGEAETIRRRHAEYYVELAERAEPELRQKRHLYWFQQLETEHENMRVALRWSLGNGDITLGARLAGALCLFWFACGQHIEGRQWSQQLLARLGDVAIIYHPKLLFTAGHMALLYDLDTARGFFEQALQICRERGDSANIAWSLIFLSYAMLRDTEKAIAFAEEGLSLFRELNHRPGIAQALNIIGEITLFSGDDDHARRAYEESLAVSQETGETRRIRFMFANLAFLALHAGDYERARQFVEQGLLLALEMNNKLDIADSLAGLAGIMAVTGQPEPAARLFGASEVAMDRLGAFRQPADKPEHDRNIALARSQLNSAAFEAAWAEGRAMTLEQAVEFARQLKGS